METNEELKINKFLAQRDKKHFWSNFSYNKDEDQLEFLHALYKLATEDNKKIFHISNNDMFSLEQYREYFNEAKVFGKISISRVYKYLEFPDLKKKIDFFTVNSIREAFDVKSRDVDCVIWEAPLEHKIHFPDYVAIKREVFDKEFVKNKKCFGYILHSPFIYNECKEMSKEV